MYAETVLLVMPQRLGRELAVVGGWLKQGCYHPRLEQQQEAARVARLQEPAWVEWAKKHL